MLDWFGRKLREMQEVKRDERGFTLIELLVVIVIIGILAAIAIPTFLGQRERAFNSDAQTTARNAATAAATYFVDNQSYTDMDEEALSDIEGSLPTAENEAPFTVYTVVPNGDGTDFTIQVQHQNGSQIYTSTSAGTDNGEDPPEPPA